MMMDECGKDLFETVNPPVEPYAESPNLVELFEVKSRPPFLKGDPELMMTIFYR